MAPRRPHTVEAPRARTRKPFVDGMDRAAHAYADAARMQLAEVQRGRILAAAFDVCDEIGVASVTIADVVERSGVSRRTFYELFDDREQCLLAAFEQALAYLSERVTNAFNSADGWREQVRAGLTDLLVFLDEQPEVGRLLFVGSLSAGPRVGARRAAIVEQITGIVDRGRALAKSPEGLSALTAEGIVGAVLSVIQDRLSGLDRSAKGSPLRELVNPLMGMVVLPYLGARAAQRELSSALDRLPVTARGETAWAAPLSEPGMRLTYRTVRVLVAIAEHPGASNRTIGEGAGVSDQGQISKLLRRLQRFGLVSNSDVRVGAGLPNEWSLTEKGVRFAEGIHAHTDIAKGGVAKSARAVRTAKGRLGAAR